MQHTTDPNVGNQPKAADPVSTYGSAVDPAALKRGHEADGYDLPSVISVPLLVIVFFVLAFGTVTLLFSFISHTEVDPKANPFAVEDNEAPLNDRLGRIHRGGKVDQPRLEPLRMRTGDERSVPRPETATGNSPELHPEDIVPSKENTPELYKSAWLDPTKSVARISIADAMKICAQKGHLAVEKAGSEPKKSTNVPSASNAGRGFGESTVTPPKLPATGEEKK